MPRLIAAALAVAAGVALSGRIPGADAWGEVAPARGLMLLSDLTNPLGRHRQPAPYETEALRHPASLAEAVRPAG